MNEYAEFLKGKERKTRDAGFDVPESAISDKLYDFQVAIVRWAIRKRHGHGNHIR